MGRMRRGWELTKQSWGVVRADRSLLAFPVIAGICALLAGALLFGAGAAIAAAADSFWAGLPVFIIGLYVVIVIGQYCMVALAACATRALDGRDTTVGEGFAAARSRLGVILAWAAVQLVVGALISALQALLREGAGQFVSAIVGGLANFAWTVATFFVIPVIALEGLGPKEALKRSVSVIRDRWGEGVVGSAAVGGIVFLVGVLPAIVLIGLGIAAVGSSVPLGVALIAIGAILLLVASLFQATVMAVFRVALFRFATTEEISGPFSREQLETAFRPRGRKERALGV